MLWIGGLLAHWEIIALGDVVARGVEVPSPWVFPSGCFHPMSGTSHPHCPLGLAGGSGT